MARKTITEKQYEELRSYEHGLPSSRNYPPRRPLLDNGLLAYDGHGFYSITNSGREALTAFRSRYGIQTEVVS